MGLFASVLNHANDPWELGWDSPGNEVGVALGTKSWQPRESWEDESKTKTLSCPHRTEIMISRLLRRIFFGIYSVASQRRCHQPQEFIMVKIRRKIFRILGKR